MASRGEGRPRKWKRLLQVGIFVAALAVPGVANAAQKFAVVNSDGTLVRGVGATGATHLGTGTYEVRFSSNQTACAYVATPGMPGASSILQPAVATVARRAGNSKGVFLQTFDQSTGALADFPFHLQTFCGTSYYAVIDGSTGATARSGGTHVTSSAHLGTGSYEVIFDKNIRKCAYTATIGTTADGTAPPQDISVVGRATTVNGVFVRIMDRTGAAVDASFHIEIACGSTKLLGVITAAGAKNRGANVVSSAHLGTGQYEVIFNRDVTGCAYTATVGLPGASGSVADPVAITTASRAGNANGVFLFVHRTDNSAAIDEPFHLFVQCPVTTSSSGPAASDGSQPAAGASADGVSASRVDTSVNS